MTQRNLNRFIISKHLIPKHLFRPISRTINRLRPIETADFHCKRFFTPILLASAVILSPVANAAQRIFELEVQTPQQTDSGLLVGQVTFPTTAVTGIDVGAAFEVVMPSGTAAGAQVVENSGSSPLPGANGGFLSVSDDAKVLQLDNNAGSLELHLVGNVIAGLTLHDNENGKFYRSALDGNGFGGLIEVDPDDMICDAMPRADSDPIGAPDISNVPSGLTLDIVENLESRPGATHTIFINNWGGVLSGTAWNVNYNGGADIPYTPYSLDSDTSAFSQTDIDTIWMAWAEMSEDYANFDVNITTKQSAFDATPVVDRSQIISTTTCAWYNNCAYGGVAYLSIFNSTSEYYKTGWTWNASRTSVGMTHSHEAGHQLALTHDGTSSLSYYRGHGFWGPIMGAPFGKQYVQWSIGEYDNANNFQDDLQILSGYLGVRPDDEGDSISNPNELLATTGDKQLITQGGFGADTDVFEFTLSSPQEVSIDVIPYIGGQLEDRGANLAFSSQLEDSSANVLASVSSSDNTPLRPNTNSLSFSMTLDADTYYFSLLGESPDTNWTTGFGEYGNGGEYQLMVDIDPEINSPMPGSILAGSTDTFSWTDHGNDIIDYWVNIGSVVNGGNYLAGRLLGPNETSVTSTNLPTDGSTVYVRFWWQLASGAWEYTDYTYIAAGTSSLPFFTAPTSGSTLAGPTDTFTWSANASSITEWWLYLGTTVGGKQIDDSGSLGTTATYTAYSLPTDGSTVYARLWYKEGATSRWKFIDDSFIASVGGGPTITLPMPGDTILGSPVTFEWDPGSSTITEWWIYVGTTSGGRDIYDSRSLGTAITGDLPMPADESTAYVTLWYRIGGAWKKSEFTYLSMP